MSNQKEKKEAEWFDWENIETYVPPISQDVLIEPEIEPKLKPESKIKSMEKLGSQEESHKKKDVSDIKIIKKPNISKEEFEKFKIDINENLSLAVTEIKKLGEKVFLIEEIKNLIEKEEVKDNKQMSELEKIVLEHLSKQTEEIKNIQMQLQNLKISKYVWDEQKIKELIIASFVKYYEENAIWRSFRPNELHNYINSTLVKYTNENINKNLLNNCIDSLKASKYLITDANKRCYPSDLGIKTFLTDEIKEILKIKISNDEILKLRIKTL